MIDDKRLAEIEAQATVVRTKADVLDLIVEVRRLREELNKAHKTICEEYCGWPGHRSDCALKDEPWPLL